jgi:hypothetical protein
VISRDNVSVKVNADVKNIELGLSDDVLTIKGEKKEEKEERTKDRYVSERRYGSFRRSVQLPSSIDAGKIEASYKSGILTVTLPKSAEKQRKQTVIPIPRSRTGPLSEDWRRKMAHKQVLFHSVAHEKVLRGASLLADAVRGNAGPEVQVGPDPEKLGHADRQQ